VNFDTNSFSIFDANTQKFIQNISFSLEIADDKGNSLILPFLSTPTTNNVYQFGKSLKIVSGQRTWVATPPFTPQQFHSDNTTTLLPTSENYTLP